MYMSIVTGKRQDKILVKCTVKILQFKNMDEVSRYCIDLLNDSEIAYIHTQQSTYNNYIKAEEKTMQDYSCGVYNQTRYTKDEQYTNNSICCKTILI